MTEPVLLSVKSVLPKTKFWISLLYLGILNAGIVFVYFYDAIYTNLIFIEISYWGFFVFEFIYFVLIIVPFFLTKNYLERDMVVTNNGITLHPLKIIAGIPLQKNFSERWADIESYCFLTPPRMICTEKWQKSMLTLHITTKGINKRCTNNIAVSVFTLLGYFMDNETAEGIKQVFQCHNVKYKQRDKNF